MARKRVDFRSNVADLMVPTLATLGFATTFICARTGLSPGQVQYRLALSGVTRREYRNGRSAAATEVLERVMPAVRQKVLSA